MSNNKTIIPGIQSQASSQQTFGQPSFPPPGQTLSPLPGQETVVPGISPSINGANVPAKGQLFGFLFSVSKTMAGEYWPIMLGANTIGRGANNTINLGEMTISETHASIHVISRFNKLIAYIKDDASKTGTLLNGELLRGEADLKTGDIITIGEQYELYVVLINAVELGLSVKPDFKSVSPTIQNSGFFDPNLMPTVQPRVTGTATVIEGQTNVSSPQSGGHTVIMGGNNNY